MTLMVMDNAMRVESEVGYHCQKYRLTGCLSSSRVQMSTSENGNEPLFVLARTTLLLLKRASDIKEDTKIARSK